METTKMTTKRMKWKSLILITALVSVFLVEGPAFAQQPETVLQPEHVTIYRQSSPFLNGTFEYDANGSLFRYHEDRLNDSTHQEYLIDYDANLDVKTIERKTWGWTRYPYMYAEQYNFSYDNHGLVEKMEVLWHDGHNDEYWVPEKLWIPIYDDQGRLAMDTMYYVAIPEGYQDYAFLWEHHYTYGDATRTSLYTHREVGIKTNRITDTIAENGVLIVVEEQLIDGSFVNSRRWDYTYNNDRILSIERREWDGTMWQNDMLTLYSYDSAENLVMKEFRIWDGVNYCNNRRTRFVLNNEGLPRTILFEQWEQDSWQEGRNDGQLVLAGHLLGKRMCDFILDNRVANDNWKSFLSWFYNDDGISRIDFTYIETTAPSYLVQEATVAGNDVICVHPNPTEGVFTVSGESLVELQVYNTLGQRVLTLQPSENTATIDLTGQPAGMYFINVTDQSGVRCVKKIVKQ